MQRNRTAHAKSALMAAAALALGTFTLPALLSAGDEPQQPQRQPTADAGRPGRSERSDQAAETRAVRDLLARCTDAGLRNDGFNEVTALFSPAAGIIKIPTAGNVPSEARDAARTVGVDTKKLDGRVAQFRKDWKEKYGQEFRIGDGAVVYADISASNLSAGDAQLAAARIRAGVNDAAIPDKATPDKALSDRALPDKTATDKSGPDQTPSRVAVEEIITLRVPAYHKIDAVDVTVVREGTGTYHFAGQQGMDYQRLADSLAKHIGQVDDAKANWPNDVNEASRAVTQHVLMAISEAKGSHAPAHADVGK